MIKRLINTVLDEPSLSPPEIIVRGKDFTIRQDIYSLSVVVSKYSLTIQLNLLKIILRFCTKLASTLVAFSLHHRYQNTSDLHKFTEPLPRFCSVCLIPMKIAALPRPGQASSFESWSFQSYDQSIQYNFINRIFKEMSRMLKDPKSIGKLSTRKMMLFQQSKDKKVSAILPPMREKERKYRLSQSALLAEGKQDPLPYIKMGVIPLKTKHKSFRNPQDQIFFVDGNKRKIGHCMAVQMSSPRHSQAGKLYNPSLQIFPSPGKIRHQPQSEITNQKDQTENIKNFKNFLQHRYVQQIKEKRNGVTLIEYDHRFSDSVGSIVEFDKSQKRVRYEQQSEILPICSENEAKSFYLSTNFSKMNEIYLKNQGEDYRHCYKEQVNGGDQEIESEFQESLLLVNEEAKLCINMQTPISRLKQLLIEEENNISLSFSIPKILKQPLKNLTTQAQIHQAAHQIFLEMANFKPQLISLKKFANCILIVAKSPFALERSVALLWYYNGSFYFGQWQGNNQAEGRKSSAGIEYTSNHHIYFGKYANNQRQGYGIMKMPKGDIYVGEWSNGERSGWGKLFDEHGKLSLDGNFAEDSFLESRLESRVIL